MAYGKDMKKRAKSNMGKTMEMDANRKNKDAASMKRVKDEMGKVVNAMPMSAKSEI